MGDCPDEAADLDEEVTEDSSPSSALSSIATLLMGCETAAEKWSGCGRVRKGLTAVEGGGEEASEGGGVIFTLGRFAPLRTELLFPPRLQDTAASDLEGPTTGEPLLLLLLPPRMGVLATVGVPREVPPEMTVVWADGTW